MHTGCNKANQERCLSNLSAMSDYVPTAKPVAWKARAPPLRVGFKGLAAQSLWAIILPKAEKSQVHEERKRLGVLSQGDNKARRKPSAVKSKKADVHSMKREIASLQVKLKNLKTKRSASSDDMTPRTTTSPKMTLETSSAVARTRKRRRKRGATDSLGTSGF